MPKNAQNPADAVVWRGPDSKSFPANCDLECTAPTAFIQQVWLASRFRLHADRARLTAELAFATGGR